jgi:hypothetical protein
MMRERSIACERAFVSREAIMPASRAEGRRRPDTTMEPPEHAHGTNALTTSAPALARWTRSAVRWAKAGLGTRKSLVWAVALGVLFACTSLGAGLVFDDYLFAIVLRKLPMVVPQTGPLDLFRFADGDPKTARGLMDIGQIPWTADPATRGAFLRPLSALTHMLDEAVWPGSPAAMHAHSLAWFAVALAGAGLVYRRVLGVAWAAGLAALLYAVDDSHGATVAWIANRNAWVAAAFAFPALALHDRFRRDGWRAGRWLAPLFMGAALLGGESAVGIAPYLVAYALHLDRAPSLRARLLSLAPYVALLVAWRVAYARAGFGVYGSSIYVDPGQDPLLFLGAVARRAPLLLLGALAFPKPDYGELYEVMAPGLLPVMLAAATAALGGMAFALRRVWREEPAARFFATGMLLAALPVCATAAGDRLLVFVSFGAMGLVAVLIASAANRGERRLAKALGVLHLGLAPLLLAQKSASVPFAVPHAIADAAVPKTPDVMAKTALFLNPPMDGFAGMLIAQRIVRGEPRPAQVRTLAGMDRAIDVVREDDRTLVIRPERGFLEHAIERGWRRSDRPLPVGAVVETTGMTVTVTASTPDGRPAEARFRFDRPLDDPSFLWLRWNRGAFAPWVPPPIGGSAHLPGYGLREALADLPRILAR